MGISGAREREQESLYVFLFIVTIVSVDVSFCPVSYLMKWTGNHPDGISRAGKDVIIDFKSLQRAQSCCCLIITYCQSFEVS